jgi:hypothetical protein
MKAVFNLRGDNSAQTVDLAVDANQGWKGHESYMATVPVSSETISRIVGFFHPYSLSFVRSHCST